MKMTVYFDGVFWSALIEFSDSKGRYKAFRHVFGPEPKHKDIMDFISFSLGKELCRYERVETSSRVEMPLNQKKVNPKRMQRQVNKAKKQPVLSTKAQLVMQEMHTILKEEKKIANRELKEVDKQFKYQQKKEKRHQKKRGH